MNDWGMKKSTKIWLGIAAFWPLIYIPVFIAAIFGLIFAGPVDAPGAGFGAMVILLFILHAFTIFLSLGLTIFFIFHVVKNDSFKPEIKALWIVLFFFAGMIVEPVYWYLNIWKGPDDDDPPAQLNPQSTSFWNASSEVRTGEYQPPSEPPDWR